MASCRGKCIFVMQPGWGAGEVEGTREHEESCRAYVCAMAGMLRFLKGGTRHSSHSSTVVGIKQGSCFLHASIKICMFAQGLANVWGPLDDVVMGGVSQSGFEVRQGAGQQKGPAGIFSGQVSSSNNGGFASVSPPSYMLPLLCQKHI